MASRCDRIRDGHYAERSSDMDSGEFPVRDGHDSSVPTHGIPGVDLAGTNWPLYKLEALAAGVAVLVGALLVTGTAQTAVLTAAAVTTGVWWLRPLRDVATGEDNRREIRCRETAFGHHRTGRGHVVGVVTHDEDAHAVEGGVEHLGVAAARLDEQATTLLGRVGSVDEVKMRDRHARDPFGKRVTGRRAGYRRRR